MLPKIAVITPVYNRAHLLPATLNSILTQTEPNFELLIWDDGSTDNSLAIAHTYAQQDPRIRIISAPNQGQAAAFQAASAHTTAPYLGVVDSDDLLAPTTLATTAAYLDTHPETGMVYTNYHIIDAQGNDHGLGHRCTIPYDPIKLLVEFMTFHFRLIRRTTYNQVGGIDPTFQFGEDYDLCLKLSEVTTIGHIPEPLYFHRRHPQNKTNNQLESIRWAEIAIRNALKRRGWDAHYNLETRIVSHFGLIPKNTNITAPHP
jgi:glycosyltransferase involved in cell wall biosynthesis